MRVFFDEFERASAALDVDAVAAQFAEVFMNADPNGVTAVPRSALRAGLPQRQRLFDMIGARAIRLTSLTETRLDDGYLLVDTQWAAEVHDPSGRRETLPLSSSFILRRDGGSLVVVFYLNHQDIVALAQARGCLPGNSRVTGSIRAR